jgi:copper chaperone CopZ
MKTSASILTIVLATCLAFITSSATAGDKAATYTYKGEVAGVVCNACASKVKAALGKLEGVQSVTITVGEDKAALPKIELVSTSPRLTRADAVKSLGEAAQVYDIRSLQRVEK